MAVVTLEGLSETQRDALAVLCLVDDSAISRTAWQESIAYANVLDERGKRLYGSPFKALVEDAVARGAAVEQRHGYTIAPAWIAPILGDTHRRRRLQLLALQVRQATRLFSGGAPLRPAFRLALTTGQPADLEVAKAALRMSRAYARTSTRLVDILGLDVPASWLGHLDGELRAELLLDASDDAFFGAKALGTALRDALESSTDPELRARWALVRALAGDAEGGRRAVGEAGTTTWERGARGFLALTEGRFADARARFTEAATGKRGQRIELPGPLALLDALLATTSDDGDEVRSLAARLEKSKRHVRYYPFATQALDELARSRSGGARRPRLGVSGVSWADVLIDGLVGRWLGREVDATRLAWHASDAKANGYAWLASELASVAADGPDGTLSGLLGRKEPWELALDALDKALGEDLARPAARAAPEASVAWNVALYAGMVVIEAYLVTPRSTVGKRISFDRLRIGADVPLDEADRRVVDAVLRAHDRSPYGLPPAMLLSLVGHPRVRDKDGRPLAVERGVARIQVQKSASGAKVVVTPPTVDATGAFVSLDPVRRVLTVFVDTPETARARAALGASGASVPRKGLERLTEVLAKLQPRVAIDLDEKLTDGRAEADARLYLQLFRRGEGLRARLCVMPGGASGLALRPGAPPGAVVVKGARGLVRVERDLEAERLREEALLARAPMLAALPLDGDDRVARDLAACLELLLELAGLDVIVTWPEGQALRAPTVRSARDVRVRVRGDASWLEVDGEIAVDEERVVAMKTLLESASLGQGRFIAIGPDEYVALTNDVRAKLEALDRLRGLGTDGRVPAALLPAVGELTADLDVDFTADLVRRRELLERASTDTVRVPKTLTAELRDYQRDGFVFLARRADAGLGACLADDMGLGKTLQALALLAHRAKRGPALVVAPTSVCRNWQAEASRFAPSLRFVVLGEGNRDETLDGAGRGDVVVVSYALLVAEEAKLARRTWSTVVFDEAHAVKNAATRRWAAARGVPAEVKIALTGTPVENHVGELHAIFDLVAPGMLGSRTRFERVFGAAGTAGHRDVGSLLRRLVRPFVLRRTKGEVLSELPPKTEILRVVTPSAEHRAFYEAVRLRAKERADKASRSAAGRSGGKARIELLAEITRLRRVAIDPRLSGVAGAPEGAKLTALVELIEELRAEGRRALVFSQFLEVLDLARERLAAVSVECRRLDGTMSADARAAEVEAFQSGEGDVFLLSLRAGGVGMNLTAADTVVLLDPWWNPAVEDQASDRAHRIGQTRPVMVVRLVTEGTIEEKVLTLHARKRKLYEDVMEGADGGGTLDVAAIAELLEEGGVERGSPLTR